MLRYERVHKSSTITEMDSNNAYKCKQVLRLEARPRNVESVRFYGVLRVVVWERVLALFELISTFRTPNTLDQTDDAVT